LKLKFEETYIRCTVHGTVKSLSQS